MLELLYAFRDITASDRGSTRIAYTSGEQAAHDLVWEFLGGLDGLTRVEDAAGNLFVVPETALQDATRTVLLLGSHLDTVIEGGWLDGTLGVAAAMTALRSLARGGRAHPDVGLVVFRDEEGVRFNTGLFGSSVFAGRCGPEDLEVHDADGVRVGNVVPDPAGCVEYRPPVTPRAFLECHIEQGLRLIDRNERIGVVSGIVGIRRYLLTAVGTANHAGTTGMDRRRDALVPAADVIARLPELVKGLASAVITCGRLSVEPGAANIVPGRVEGVIEMRAETVADLDVIGRRLGELVSEARNHTDVELRLEPIVAVEPVATDVALRDTLRSVLDESGVPYSIMPSMAGHDTQHAAYRCPAAMFFIPSLNGISHNPDEASRPEDIELAGTVMTAWAQRCLDASG